MRTNRSIILKDEFVNDLSESINWYDQKREHLGGELLKEVNLVLTQIENYPEGFPITSKKYRQAILKRFPYLIVYRIYVAEVIIYSLFHTSRNPKKIKKEISRIMPFKLNVHLLDYPQALLQN